MVQHQCDAAKSQFLALRMAWEEDHLKHKVEVKSLMMDAMRTWANTEEEAASASTKTKELGQVMK